MPALMCTTVPPAKSIAPHEKIRPASASDRVELGLRGRLGCASVAAASALAASAIASGPAQYQTMCAIGK